MAKRTPLALRYDLGGRAERALRAIGAQDDDDLASIDIRRLRDLRAIGEGTILEIRKARTRLMKSRHGAEYSDDLTVPLLDPVAHEALVKSLGVGPRAARAMDILGIDSARKLMDLNVEMAADTRGVNPGALREVRAARETMMLAQLDTHRVLVDRIGPDDGDRTPVDFTGELLWIARTAGRETAGGRLSVPYTAILSAREWREEQRVARDRQRALRRAEAPFDEADFMARHRLNRRAMTALHKAGVTSDESFAAIDLDALAATRSIGVRTMEVIRRARVRMIVQPGDKEDRAERMRDARALARRMNLSRDAVEILAQAGVARREDLVSMDLTAQMDLHRGRGRVSRAVKSGIAEIREVQHRLIRGLGEDVTADDRLVNRAFLDLAERHELPWRAAKAFSLVGASSDDDLADLDFDTLSRADGVGSKTVEKIRAARTAMMKARHGEDFEDDRTRPPEDETETMLVRDLELSRRAAGALDHLGIRTAREFLDMDIPAVRNLEGIGAETANELFKARAALVYELAGIARAVGTQMATSKSGKGLLVEFKDGEQLWLPKTKCTLLPDNQVAVPRGLMQASREWMNAPKQTSPELEPEPEEDLLEP